MIGPVRTRYSRSRMPVAAEPCAERRLHRGDGSRQIDGALREAHARHVQTVRMREFLHDGDVARRGAVLGAKGFVADASERGAAGRRAQRFLASQPHRHVDPVGFARRADVLRRGERRLGAPRQCHASSLACFGHAILRDRRLRVRMKVASHLLQAYDASLSLPQGLPCTRFRFLRLLSASSSARPLFRPRPWSATSCSIATIR